MTIEAVGVECVVSRSTLVQSVERWGKIEVFHIVDGELAIDANQKGKPVDHKRINRLLRVEMPLF